MTELNARAFKKKIAGALKDKNLQEALSKVEKNFIERRASALEPLPEFEDIRNKAVEIKNHTLDHLDLYLAHFASKVEEHGGVVHWCDNAEQAREAILNICRAHNAKSVTKGKSMVSEEIALNAALQDAGIQPVETDLGEYIIQLADEPPSHIIAPVVHKTKAQVETIFREHHHHLDEERDLSDGESLVGEARTILREKYFQADVGITGANFLIAETGSTTIVTNEGNGDLTQALPDVHVVVASIEKVVPTLEDATTLMRLLARSATGQDMSVYTTFSTGPKRKTDKDGPSAFHVVLLDNGRSRILGSKYRDILRCIRCAACMNHCPVYAAVGGHAYGSTYMGPVGSVLTPAIWGIDSSPDLPNASTFCGRCAEVCPMKIPLPDLMRDWRNEASETEQNTRLERLAINAWSYIAKRPALYRRLMSIACFFGNHLAGSLGHFRELPGLKAWTRSRVLPAPARESFMQQYARRQRS
ncbi:MAG: iron-sulfur cluster-binding protein [Alphaproteobacteria bacterium]|nr:iron-sulfur cluster-binding protein [Alphaproteobacteria bacterium]